MNPADFDDLSDEDCPRCGGEGGWHDCGEDVCCCADWCVDDDNVICSDCQGSGVCRPSERDVPEGEKL